LELEDLVGEDQRRSSGLVASRRPRGVSPPKRQAQRCYMYAMATRSSDSELGRRAALLRRHRAALLGVLRSRGATNPRIFGSLARGEEHDGSDIDLLVDLPDGYSLVDLAGLSLEISELLGEAVDLATPDLLKADYLKAALKDALPL
jgi:predicted nucleotidyltransferase